MSFLLSKTSYKCSEVTESVSKEIGKTELKLK